MIKYYCDRCEGETGKDTLNKISTGDDTSHFITLIAELCPDCHKELKTWLNLKDLEPSTHTIAEFKDQPPFPSVEGGE